MTPTLEQQAIIDESLVMRVRLSQGKFALIDREDYTKVMSFGRKWFATLSRRTFYAVAKYRGK